MKNLIQHQTQTLKDNCVSACLGMVLNIDVDKVTYDFHQGYHDGYKEPFEYLDSNGLAYRNCMSNERSMKPDHVYIVIVPSINITAGLHCMVIHMTSDSRWVVYDPNSGRKNTLSYGSFGKNDIPDGCVQIGSWVLEYEFKVEDIANRYGVDNPFNGEYIGCDAPTEGE